MRRAESEERLDDVREEEVEEQEEGENLSARRVREIGDSLAYKFSGWFATEEQDSAAAIGRVKPRA
jgi:hypothetical protein